MIGVWSEVSAREVETLPITAIQQNMVEVPTIEIEPAGKAAFSVRETDADLLDQVLLSFAAITPFDKAEIADGSSFEQRGELAHA